MEVLKLNILSLELNGLISKLLEMSYLLLIPLFHPLKLSIIEVLHLVFLLDYLLLTFMLYCSSYYIFFLSKFSLHHLLYLHSFPFHSCINLCINHHRSSFLNIFLLFLSSLFNNSMVERLFNFVRRSIHIEVVFFQSTILDIWSSYLLTQGTFIMGPDGTRNTEDMPA